MQNRVMSQISASFLLVLLLFSLLVCNFFQIFAVLIFPFSRDLARRYSRFFMTLWQGFYVFLITKIRGVKMIVTGDRLESGENAVVISNHQSYPDSLALSEFFFRFGRLSHSNCLAKDVLKYTPGIGWAMWLMGVIFIKRNWMDDRNKIEQAFHNIRKYKIPVCLVSFLEGTRRTPEKLLASQRYAEKNGLPVLRHLLLPRTKGFIAILKGLGEDLGAVYDVTIAYPSNETATLWGMLSGSLKTIHLHAKRYSRLDIPKTDAEVSKWLYDLFIQKERRLDQFDQYNKLET